MAAKAAKAADNTVTGEVVPTEKLFNEDQLREIDSFDAAMALVQQTLGAVTQASDEIGDGFATIESEEKIRLIGIPCLFIGWQFHWSTENDAEFVSIQVAGRTDGGGLLKVRISDGSTGIYRTIRAYTDRTGKMGGLFARKGLRASKYYVDKTTGEIFQEPGPGRKEATTFYIDASA